MFIKFDIKNLPRLQAFGPERQLMSKPSHAANDAAVQQLRAQAERYRWLAQYVTDQNVAARIRELADELDAKADELAGNSH